MIIKVIRLTNVILNITKLADKLQYNFTSRQKQVMYGTLEDRVGSGHDSGNNKQNANAPTTIITSTPGNDSNESSLTTSQEIQKRKRIYSHCHIQANDDESKSVDKSARRRLIAASIICLIFMVGEVVGGVLSNSLAIATDAAHLLTDFASFMISLFAIWLSSRPATRKMSFGWYRAEVIGALLSVLMIWFVTGLLVYLAIERLRTKEFEIDSQVMVITASAGLLVNIIMAVALNVDGHGHSHGHFHSHGHGHHHHHHNHNHEEGCEREPIDTIAASIPPLANGKTNQSSLDGSINIKKKSSTHNHEKQGRGRSNINVRAAFIHVIGDFLQSLGVLIAALIIHFEPTYSIVDPICTFIFSIIVLITTINIIRDAINVLMEGIPDGVNFIEVRETLQELPGIIRVHNLRIWSLSLDKIAISTHLVIDDSRTPSQALKMAIDILKSRYNFFEVTIQVEEFRDDMKDCEHCQNEEVVINVVENNNTDNNL